MACCPEVNVAVSLSSPALPLLLHTRTVRWQSLLHSLAWHGLDSLSHPPTPPTPLQLSLYATLRWYVEQEAPGQESRLRSLGARDLLFQLPHLQRLQVRLAGWLSGWEWGSWVEWMENEERLHSVGCMRGWRQLTQCSLLRFEKLAPARCAAAHGHLLYCHCCFYSLQRRLLDCVPRGAATHDPVVLVSAAQWSASNAEGTVAALRSTSSCQLLCSSAPTLLLRPPAARPCTHYSSPL